MPAPELEILEQAARLAGETAMAYFGHKPEVWDKGDGQGPVSEGDLAVNDALQEFFAKELPDFAILSEEDEDSHAHSETENVLVIDPIDGTQAYIQGQKYFSTSIAWLQNDEPQAGVIYAPALEKLYAASLGNGAFCNNRAIQISSQNNLPSANVLASRARYNRAALDQDPKLQTAFVPSIALRLALVAEGQYDLTIALRPSWDWDIAAGDILMREAGGLFLDSEGQRPSYNKMIPQQNGIVAGGQDLVQAFLQRL